MTRIGVFDSGLGGLTVLAALRRAEPDLPYVYLSDAANAPYGVRPPEEICALTRAAVARLFDEGCGLVILACNTASAVALRGMQESWLTPDQPRRALGVFVPMIEAITGRGWADPAPPVAAPISEIAVFATPATAASRAFSRETALRATGVTVREMGCPGIVDAVEAGDMARAHALATGFARQMRAAAPGAQAAVLGCTHFPLARDGFAQGLGPEVRLYEQPEIVAASFADYLRRHPRFAARGAGSLRALTTGDPARVRAAAGIFLPDPPDFVPTLYPAAPQLY